ncbi:MAG: transketolase [Clostridia bacterium]|nr:transketolase [Clostridia bacterium]
MIMDIRQKTINNIRTLAADTVQKAKSGHPGAPMGMAPMAYAVWIKEMKHNPKDPAWKDRDRFVLSSGHASSLIYTMLHLTGYGLTMDDMKQFRQWGSKTPGHPEYRHTVGVETTSGPLGQGVANAVGFAIAETMMAAHFNRPGFPVVDHRVYAFCGDGCMMEGIASEAASLAGTLELGKLTLLYDDNEISIEGNTDIAFKEDVGKRFEAYGWQVIRLKDGNDVDAVCAAIEDGKKDPRPTLIVCPTKIGFGCPAKEGKPSAHGEPLGDENVAETKKNLGMPADSFCVLPEVYAHVEEEMKKNEATEKAWDDLFAAYCREYPDLAAEWEQWHNPELTDDVALNDALWQWEGKIATRATSGEMINRLAKLLPNLVGGSADLAPSNKTYIKDGGDYSAQNRAGRNLHFGVREHAMGAICNAIALHGGLRVFCGTFFVFSDYMKHAVRMAAIMKLPVTFVFTHDSIGVGEDGATHEPIEQLAGLRAIPDLLVFRPADGKETTAGWLTALTAGLPTCLILTRQNLPQYENSGCEAMKGGYILADSDKETPDVLLLASGSEVEQMMGAKEELKKEGVDARVVSMPCMELFLRQSKEYQEKVIPAAVRARVAMEAGATMPWYRFTGLDGRVIGIDHYGASAPYAVLFREFGFTVENAVQTVKEVLGK